MSRKRLALIGLAAVLAGAPAWAGPAPVDCVRPMVGTKGDGNTYPGPQVPFGMVVLSPDTDIEKWEAAAGYKYDDNVIYGFSMTHLPGTGIPDMGDILFQPTVGETRIRPGSKDRKTPGYLSGFRHDRESASVGTYSVVLDDYGVKVDLASTNRAGMLRFTYPAAKDAHVVLDLAHVLQHKVIWSRVRAEDGATLVGMHKVKGWAKDRDVFFAARFSRPFKALRLFSGGREVKYDSFKSYRYLSETAVSGPDVQAVADYETSAGEPILVKVGISPVSEEAAMRNLDQEMPDWNFDACVERSRSLWSRELAKFDVDGTDADRATFYTSLYHAFLAPSTYQDVDGRTRGQDFQVKTHPDHATYTTFSLWDTYRATHPLFNLVQADRNRDMVLSLLDARDESPDHILPIWYFWNNETWCMVGYHAAPVLVDAYFKGMKGVDWNRALDACVASATHPRYDALTAYEHYGYVPYDLENESVSKTLEYAYDDACIARLAKALGRQDVAARFEKRAQAYRNLYDPSIHWMRPKDSHGAWLAPFDTFAYKQGGPFTEGTTWQYTWSVAHDVAGLIQLMGGREAFCRNLDDVFREHHVKGDVGLDDVGGRIGEYWHGNEPSHHVAYLFAVAGQPWKTQKFVRQIIDTQYGPEPGSLSGNDDAGQMSAWYLFSAMGFYPLCPGDNRYVLGSPAFPKVVMHLSNGRTFTVRAEKFSKENVYVQKATLDGRPLAQPWISHEAVAQGGELVFTLGPKPNTKWGANPPEPFAGMHALPAASR